MLRKKKPAIAPRGFYIREVINPGAITPLVVTPVVIIDCRLSPVVISVVIVPFGSGWKASG